MKHRHFPHYIDDADFTTNAPSYYEDLARKEKLIRLLAERIWGYEKILDETLEEIQERFRAWDKNLEDFPDDVKALLQQWLDDGTLDHIINDTIFKWKLDTAIFEQFRDSITAQLQQKVSKGNVSVTDINKNLGKFDQTFMADEFLQQMAGNTPINAVPADNSITYDKMAFNAVVGVPSRNLFNKNAVTTDSYVSTGSGKVLELSGYSASEFIGVEPSKEYAILKPAKSSEVAFYDETKTFISGIDSTNGYFITPANCRFVRITTKIEDLDTQQLEMGKVRTPYTSHYPKFDVGYLIPQGVPSRNIFNKVMGSNGFYVNISTGKNSALPGYNASDFMLVEPSSDYVMSRSSNVQDVSFYDENKVFISAIDKSNGQFTTPVNAHFIRVTTKIEHLDSQQIEKGTSSTPYVNALPQVDLSSVAMPRRKNIIVVAKENGDFETITEAVLSTSYATKENPVTILVMPGTYKEHVNLAGRYVSIVGANADTTIIRMDEGEYFRNPLNISANNHIYNLTLISTDDEPNNTSGLSPYCLHCDSGALEGKSVIENVRMINTVGVAVGLGTQSNQTYHFKNCDMYSLQNGFYGHNKQQTGGVNQKVILDNCRIKSQNERAIFIQDANHREGGSKDDQRDTEFHFYNNMFWSEINGKTNIIGGDSPLDEDSRWGYIKVSADSYGNNLDELNK